METRIYAEKHQFTDRKRASSMLSGKAQVLTIIYCLAGRINAMVAGQLINGFSKTGCSSVYAGGWISACKTGFERRTPAIRGALSKANGKPIRYSYQMMIRHQGGRWGVQLCERRFSKTGMCRKAVPNGKQRVASLALKPMFCHF